MSINKNLICWTNTCPVSKICKTGQKIMFSVFQKIYLGGKKMKNNIKMSKIVSLEVEYEWLVTLVPTLSAVSFCACSCTSRARVRMASWMCGTGECEGVWRGAAIQTQSWEAPQILGGASGSSWGKKGPAGETLGLPPSTLTSVSTFICCCCIKV